MYVPHLLIRFDAVFLFTCLLLSSVDIQEYLDILIYIFFFISKQTGQTVGNFQAEIIGTVEKCYRFTGKLTAKKFQLK